jgi:dTDP-4-dehydrorhamnose 3,5-epimerase-like enzyme
MRSGLEIICILRLFRVDEITVSRSGYFFARSFRRNDGSLFALEGGRSFPFEIRRVYYITDLREPNAVRGMHAHRQLEQAIFCLSGSCNLQLDDGNNQQTILMDNPEIGVFLGKMLWHSMTNFSSDCLLLVIASNYYEESDYIRDYSDFIAETSSN